MTLSGFNIEKPLGSSGVTFHRLQPSWMTPVRLTSFQITKADPSNARIHG